jgi:hypothetical protein
MHWAGFTYDRFKMWHDYIYSGISLVVTVVLAAAVTSWWTTFTHIRAILKASVVID